MQVKILVTAEKLEIITIPLTNAINDAQMKGATIDEVLVGMMVMLGSAIKQRNATLLVDEPLRIALPPIVEGYENQQGLADLMPRWTENTTI